jgi:hypothetical protein
MSILGRQKDKFRVWEGGDGGGDFREVHICQWKEMGGEVSLVDVYSHLPEVSKEVEGFDEVCVRGMSPHADSINDQIDIVNKHRWIDHLPLKGMRRRWMEEIG